MGTRCLTIFHEKDTEIAVLYRQSDGYPYCHGKKLAEFLKGKTVVNGMGFEDRTKIFNGMGCLAAQVISHFKNKTGLFYLYPAGTKDIWEDYTYHVYGDTGCEPKIEIKDPDEILFYGTATEALKWIESQDS